MARSRLSIAKADIVKAMEDSKKSVFRKADIEKVLSENRSFWRLAQATTANAFIEFLLEKTELRKHRFGFPNRPTIRYSWRAASTFALIQSLNEDGYFSHLTALHLHGLTDQIPKTVYLNVEQRLRSGGGTLTQAAINRAFASRCRISANQATFGDQTVCLLNGANTDALGVVHLTLADGAQIRVTNIERTLIDIVVRPIYSGGVEELLRAFEEASGKVSINKMAVYLHQLNYTYPYHQSIGYLLERTGKYSATEVSLFEQMPCAFDFFITHQMKLPDFNQKWRLFVPKGF